MDATCHEALEDHPPSLLVLVSNFDDIWTETVHSCGIEWRHVTAWLGSSTKGWMSVGPDSMRLNRPPTQIRPNSGSISGASELSLLLEDTGSPAFRHLTSSGKLSAWLDFSRWRKAGPWIYRFGVASSARVLPLVKSSARLFSVSTYHQVREAVRSWIVETLVPTKTLKLQDSDVNQVRTVVESVQR